MRSQESALSRQSLRRPDPGDDAIGDLHIHQRAVGQGGVGEEFEAAWERWHGARPPEVSLAGGDRTVEFAAQEC
jgi:hypothetical protein